MDQFVAAVSNQNAIDRHVKFATERLLESERGAVRIDVQVLDRLFNCCHRLGRWAEGIFVACKFHDGLQPQFTLDLLNRFPRGIGGHEQHIGPDGSGHILFWHPQRRMDRS